MFKLFRTGECRRTHESVVGQRLRIRCSVKSFGQTEIDYFHHRNPALAERAYFTSLGAGLDRSPSLRGRPHLRASDLLALNRGGLTRVFLRRPGPR